MDDLGGKDQVAEIIGMKGASLGYIMRKDPTFPRPVRFGGKNVWKLSVIRQWMVTKASVRDTENEQRIAMIATPKKKAG